MSSNLAGELNIFTFPIIFKKCSSNIVTFKNSKPVAFIHINIDRWPTFSRHWRRSWTMNLRFVWCFWALISESDEHGDIYLSTVIYSLLWFLNIFRWKSRSCEVIGLFTVILKQANNNGYITARRSSCTITLTEI